MRARGREREKEERLGERMESWKRRRIEERKRSKGGTRKRERERRAWKREERREGERKRRREKEKEGKESKNLPLLLRVHAQVRERRGRERSSLRSERMEKREKSGRRERGKSDFSLSCDEERERERGFLPSFLYLRINALKMVLIYEKSRTFYLT